MTLQRHSLRLMIWSCSRKIRRLACASLMRGYGARQRSSSSIAVDTTHAAVGATVVPLEHLMNWRTISGTHIGASSAAHACMDALLFSPSSSCTALETSRGIVLRGIHRCGAAAFSYRHRRHIRCVSFATKGISMMTSFSATCTVCINSATSASAWDSETNFTRTGNVCHCITKISTMSVGTHRADCGATA